VLQRVKKERYNLQTVKRRKATWIGHMLHRNCLLKQVIEGNIGGMIDVTGIRGRRRKQVLDDVTDEERTENLRSTRSHCVENLL
jgi:hypothetical protein